MAQQQIAGRYDVVREIGRGGMGSVWLCTDRVLGREVALKQVGGLPGESVPQMARTLREARSSASLNHPHVVAVFDAVDDGDRLWLVMEYLPSRTLAQVVKEDGALTPGRVADLGAQVADGLAAAHARGTVHRDVKPGNILVTADDRAKISDFGIARTLGEDQLTQTGLVSGTPLYFSPELARGAAPSPAADVWALGASLYTAVEGGAPWPQQDNAIAMLVHIASNEPPVARHAGPLAQIIGEMMDVDPDLRPSMEQARARLREVPRDAVSPVVAPDPDAGSTQALAGLAPFAAATPEATAPPPPTPAEPTVHQQDDGQGRRRRLVPVLLVAAVALALVVGVGFAIGLGRDDEPTATPEATGQSTDPSQAADEPSEDASPSEEPSEEPPETTEPPADPETSDSAPAPTEDDAAGFVEDYYALLPGDTRAAWEMLDPGYQATVGSYGDYRGFWNTIDSVSVDQATAQDGVVQVSLTYVTDGAAQSETRQITVGDTGDGQRIVADTAI